MLVALKKIYCKNIFQNPKKTNIKFTLNKTKNTPKKAYAIDF